MEKKKLDEILKKHAVWLDNKDGGKRADLRDADLTGADLRCADLRDADLRDADLSGANLRCADLTGALLSCADLIDTDLRDADLHCADLSGAFLSGADLSGTFLSGADLSGAAFADHIVCLDRIGSEKRRTTYNATKDIVWCGCFRGTFEKWVAKIRTTYPDENNVYRKEYEAAIAFFKTVAEANEEKAQNG